MKGNFFTIGMKVQLQIKDDGKENQFFPSKIEDFEEENLIVGMPIKNNCVHFIPLNKLIYVYFSRKDSFYRVECKVIERKYEPIPVLILMPLKLPYKYQRRDFFRITITLDVEIIMLTNEILKGKIKNISGSGALLALPQKITKGQIVRIEFRIKEKLFQLKGRVIRCCKNEIGCVNPYNIAVQFIEINEKTQDEIVKFALEKQRKLRKRGII